MRSSRRLSSSHPCCSISLLLWTFPICNIGAGTRHGHAHRTSIHDTGTWAENRTGPRLHLLLVIFDKPDCDWGSVGSPGSARGEPHFRKIYCRSADSTLMSQKKQSLLLIKVSVGTIKHDVGLGNYCSPSLPKGG
jgi:hypothetical protein